MNVWHTFYAAQPIVRSGGSDGSAVANRRIFRLPIARDFSIFRETVLER